MSVLKFKMSKGENWYGGNVREGWKQPVNASKIVKLDNTKNVWDQTVPFYVSDKGRYLWCDEAFEFKATLGNVTCSSKKAQINLYTGYKTLKGAYTEAQKRFFPPDGKMPDELMFRVPQYCTWIELATNQTQEGILNYAKSIIECGMPAGEIIIDDGWQNEFGDWKFDEKKFDDPKKMVKKLNEMGFKVILWICPFVSPKSENYKTLEENGALVRDASGKTAIRNWWNGDSAVLDMSCGFAVEWFYALCDGLMKDYGIEGFKQDAGDGVFYRDDDITAGKVSANEQSELWMKSALKFRFNELRASFKGGGVGVAMRLGDKGHSWDDRNGLRALIPNALTLGVTGHPFCCPDMIGGGLNGNFVGKGEDALDRELFVRSAQCSALMPMMQYSRSIWRFKDGGAAKAAIAACDTHEVFSDYIVSLAKEAAVSGEPIIRFMEYEFPNEGLSRAKQQFMLGGKYLVAPVVKKGKTSRKVGLPRGRWKYLYDGSEFEGGVTVKVNAPLEVLPVFEKLK